MKFGTLPLQFVLLMGLCHLPLSAGAAGYPFSIETQKAEDRAAIVATNTGLAPVQLKLTFTGSQNASVAPGGILDFLVPPQSSVRVADIARAEPSRPWSYDYKYDWCIGDPTASPAADTVYRLPFADGEQYKLTQAPGGPVITHDTPDSRYAVDIAMPKGAPVLAARGGIVMDAVSRYGDGRKAEEFRDKANYVRILHDDGTWAEYFHLLRDSIPVVPGQRVEAGALIGLAGTSGYSDGPHLHFSVQRNAGNQVVSLPFQFYTAGRGTFVPAAGEALYADYRNPARQLAVQEAGAALPDSGQPSTGSGAKAADGARPRAD